MNHTNRTSRRGMGLVELLIAMVVLLVATVAMLGLAGTETRGVALSEDHLIARQLLDEMRQAFAGHAKGFYAALPAPPPADQELVAGPEGHLDASLVLAATVVLEDPGVTGRAPGFGADPAEGEALLETWMDTRQAVRGAYLEEDPVTSTRLLVLRVQYRNPAGALRTLETFVPVEA